MEKRLSKLALTAFIMALAGALLCGLPGFVAIVLGAIAIGVINSRRDLSGSGLAAAAVIIGIIDVIGWVAAACLYFLMWRDGVPAEPLPPMRSARAVPLGRDLGGVSDPIARAIRANVLIMARRVGVSGEGSGVIAEARGDQILVITNRHVVLGSGRDPDAAKTTRIEVGFWDGARVNGKVEWVGPDGVDLAVVSCTPGAALAEVACIRLGPRPVIGESVFAIGNPLGLGWSYSQGVISAMRTQAHAGGQLHVIQTQVPLNPGNSGGGLYDESGNLVGINTFTGNKKSTEGIGFALAISELVPYLEGDAGLRLNKRGLAPRPLVAPDP